MSIPRLPELLIILFIVFLIFGAGKLPDVASSLGKSIREFRKGSQDSDVTGANSSKTKEQQKPAATTDKT